MGFACFVLIIIIEECAQIKMRKREKERKRKSTLVLEDRQWLHVQEEFSQFVKTFLYFFFLRK